MSKLKDHEKHILRLVQKGADAEGWSPVSAMLMPLVSAMPADLVTTEALEVGGRIKLTEAGQTVLNWI